MRVKEITYYLEMTDPGELRPAPAPKDWCEIRPVTVPCPEFNRFFYTAVGGDWFWVDRLPWTHDDWLCYLTQPGQETWVLLMGGNPAGYFELTEHPGEGVELAFFGLLPRFIGRGLGGHLLTAAIRRAWAKKPVRVWLHTSSLDHPSALPSYQARGFRLYKQDEADKELPDSPIGPWPGARSG